MAELCTASEREVTVVSLYNEDKRVSVAVALEGLKRSDFYATNLYLTGSTNWFGSRNMCDLLNDNSKFLFDNNTDEIAGTSEGVAVAVGTECPSTALTHSLTPRPLVRKRSLLELGSGLGRAGLMAAKLMSLYDAYDTCVLTDGEADLVTQLEANRVRNTTRDCVKTVCESLWWGECSDLQRVHAAHPLGFDLIIGSDLIYGPKAEEAMHAMLATVSTLLLAESESSASSVTSTDTITVDESDDSHAHSLNTTPGSLSKQPSFLLAYMRSGSIPLDELFEEATKKGLSGAVLEDYTWDIFGNNVEIDSMFWSDTILQFTRTSRNPPL